MVFKNPNECIFRGMRELVSKKNGKPFTLVTIADPVSYETIDFFPDNAEDFRNLKPGQKVKIALTSNGSYTSLILSA